MSLLVNANDYAQDLNFLKTFWSIGTNGFALDSKNSDKLSAIFLLQFYPPAMFHVICNTVPLFDFKCCFSFIVQFRAHSICFKFRTSTKQKAIYLFSSVMRTLCNVLILISWQTAIVDFGIGNDIYEENSFGFFDLEILIIAFLLVTPFFYAHMVLPTSHNNFITTSINCPSFFFKMSIQCLVVSFYLGLTAFINSYVYAWGPKLQPSLGEIAANITGNRDFESKIIYADFVLLKNISEMYITPSTAYEGSPMNNRLVLIIVSCIGIPCTWIGAYLGLYAYFSEMTCNIVFYPSTRVRISNFKWYFKRHSSLQIFGKNYSLKESIHISSISLNRIEGHLLIFIFVDSKKS